MSKKKNRDSVAVAKQPSAIPATPIKREIAAPPPVTPPPAAMPQPPVQTQGEARIGAPGTVSPQQPVQNAPPPSPVMQPAAPSTPPVPAPPPPLGPPLLFECAWEVCWQLGGIYTVLRTKAPAMQRRWDDRYFLIGPYNPNTAAIEFEERPTEGFIRQALDRLREAGMPCHYGHWLIDGRPKVILLDYRARYNRLAEDKYLMWKDHGISVPASDGEVNDVVAFGFAVAEFFRHLTDVVQNRPILAHFHEWMAGVAVPRIAHMRYPITTVFTTHATLLGRYLASDNPYFYDHLHAFNGDAEAAKYNIWPKFAIERAAAHASTVFTTVSDVTSIEAEKLLGRTPDAILPNGLNIHRFAALHEFQNLHRHYKERINQFVMGHFFPSYTFDLDRTLYFFTSGRYEYRNKGMDLYIEALHRLNQRLRGVPDRPTIVAFIVTRAQTRNINVSVLQNQSMFEDLENVCDDITREMGRTLFHASATGRTPTYQELLTPSAQVRMKRAIHAWRSHRWPSIVTHDLADDANDPVLKHFRHRGLLNGADDPVKVVFHPEFMSATSPLMSLDYEQFVRGCHMGIFPSYYEPWGYTPMESIALGLPAVTSDLSGFGAYVEKHIPNHQHQGILSLKRRQRSFDQAADELADYLFNFAQMSRRQRIELRNRVERLSEMFDWSVLSQHYHDAHDMALERTGAKRPGTVEVRMV
jgi:glycogen synthase